MVVWQDLSPANKTKELEKLAKWVDWLQERYAAAGDWLQPCWWRHGFVVEELAALRTAWLGVYEADEANPSTAALDWHEAAEKCRDRIRRAIGTGPGCTAVATSPTSRSPTIPAGPRNGRQCVARCLIDLKSVKWTEDWGVRSWTLATRAAQDGVLRHPVRGQVLIEDWRL